MIRANRATHSKGIVRLPLDGVGLHTGVEANLEIHAGRPAEGGHGYKFQRIDLEGKPIIKADVEMVVSTERGTTLEQNNARVHTTEHVLAALYASGVDNALIQLNGEEVPILDGSAEMFTQGIEKAGTKELEEDFELL